MDVNHRMLKQASQAGLISNDQAERLWAFFSAQAVDHPQFRFTHILYYLGGLVAIGAMSLFMTLGWERFGGWGLFFIALAYAGGGLWLTESFLYRRRLPIPAGITAAFVVALTPLAVYGLQLALGFWADGHAYRDYHRYIDWRWLFMEFATLAVGAVLLWRYRLPFLVMPVAVTLWYMSMDVARFVTGEDWAPWALRQFVSMWFGVLMVLLAFWVDLRARQSRDYAFWLYLFGVVTFWVALTSLSSDSEWRKLGYLGINLAMIVVGAVLARRVFVVTGGLGVAIYLGHLARNVFQDSLLFPFALTLIGLGIIYLGVIWQRHETRLAAVLRPLLPLPLRERVDRHD